MNAPNVELAYRVLDHIDAHPETWSQATWACGTAACFAGWAVRLSGATLESAYARPGAPKVIDGPAELVGLPVDEAATLALSSQCMTDEEDLFDGDNTREDLGRLVAEIFGPRPERAS